MSSGFQRWERYLFGTASAPEQARESGQTPFQQGMEWMKRFLNAQGDPPTNVNFATILMGGDILQDGWPWVTMSIPVAVQPAATAIQTFQILSGIDSTQGTRVINSNGMLAQPTLMTFLGLNITHTGGAGPATVLILLGRAEPGATGVNGSAIAGVSIAVGGFARLVDTFGSAISPVCPPGYAFFVEFPATAAGETLTLNAVMAARPAGFRP